MLEYLYHTQLLYPTHKLKSQLSLRFPDLVINLDRKKLDLYRYNGAALDSDSPLGSEMSVEFCNIILPLSYMDFSEQQFAQINPCCNSYEN